MSADAIYASLNVMKKQHSGKMCGYCMVSIVPIFRQRSLAGCATRDMQLAVCTYLSGVLELCC